jgi:hypothetical protein
MCLHMAESGAIRRAQAGRRRVGLQQADDDLGDNAPYYWTKPLPVGQVFGFLENLEP